MKRKEVLTNFLSGIKKPKVTLAAPVSAFMLVIWMSSSLYASSLPSGPNSQPERQRMELFHLSIV